MGEGEGSIIWENGIETCKVSHVNWTASPGLMHETGSRGWCTGMTQRDGMGREVGAGFRMGNTGTPVADSCWCMAKPIQYCKVKNNNNKLKNKKQIKIFYYNPKHNLLPITIIFWDLWFKVVNTNSASCIIPAILESVNSRHFTWEISMDIYD